jgi:hypothetical protein
MIDVFSPFVNCFGKGAGSRRKERPLAFFVQASLEKSKRPIVSTMGINYKNLITPFFSPANDAMNREQEWLIATMAGVLEIDETLSEIWF